MRRILWTCCLLLLAVAGAGSAEEVTRVYWTEWDAYHPGLARIARANADGSGVETLVDGLTGGSGVKDLVVDSEAGKLYWANPFDGLIERANLDGSGRETVLAGVHPVGLALGGGKLYWNDDTYSDPQIRRADLDGTEPETLAYASDGCVLTGIAVDTGAGHVYWAERSDRQIWRADLGGGGATRLLDCADGIGSPWGLALSPTRIIWGTGDAIMSATRDGDDVRTVIDGLPDDVRYLERDPLTGRLYWTADGLVQCVNGDGTGLETLVTGLSWGAGFALEFGEAVAAPAPGPAAIQVSTYPNPFNPRTTVSFTLPRPGGGRVDVLDAQGRRVRTLASGVLPRGPQHLVWDGRDDAGRLLASGSYLVRLRAGGRVAASRAMLVR